VIYTILVLTYYFTETLLKNIHTANAPKANALNRGVHSNSHSVAILHLQVFIFILWETAQNFESFDIKK
jgi:hypothetical protein